MAVIDQLLQEREKTHGDFRNQARVSQSLKGLARIELGYSRLNETQRETLDHIFTKIGRILAGNPECKDHWDDIAGYATLISKQCER